MPSMNVKPEHMEYLEQRAAKLIKKAEKRGEKLTKTDAVDLAFEILVRAGIHRQKASTKYAATHKRPKAERKPRAAKKAKTPKAKKPAAPKKTAKPKAAKKASAPAAAAAPEEKPSNGGAGLLE